MLGVLWSLDLSAVAGSAEGGRAEMFARITGCSGGLCVMAGSSVNIELAKDLGRTGRYLVQILEPQPAQVDKLQAQLHGVGLYGLVSVDQLSTSRLPYTENLVNVLFVNGDATKLELNEASRVLVPGGVLLVNERFANEADLQAAGWEDGKIVELDTRWRMARKTRVKGMDQWPLPRHGADNNPVSDDIMVGPPRRVRWVNGPQQEINNMVTAGGRNFYAGVLVRDSFNGLKLWETKLTPSPAIGGFSYKVSMGSVRPVAAKDRLYAYSDKKVVALDAATGQVLREYAEAGQPQGILVERGVLLAIDKTGLRVVDVADGRLRWRVEAVEPRFVIMGEDAVHFVEGATSTGAALTLASVSLADGKPRWRKNDFDWLPKVRNLVCHDGLIACEVSTLNDNKQGNAIHILSATDGALLWSREYVPGSQHMKQARVMFVNDLIWVIEDQKSAKSELKPAKPAPVATGNNKAKSTAPKPKPAKPDLDATGSRKATCVGLDPKTGKVKKSFPAGLTHCFPPVATARYLLSGELSLTDLKNGKLDANRITKAACGRDAGWIPANGLIYTSPKHCICWPMLRDYNALAPARVEGDPMEGIGVRSFRPEPGVAMVPDGIAPESPSRDWPSYRHDARRSGSSEAAVPKTLQILWSKSLGDRPQVMIAEDWRENYFIRGPVGPPVVAGETVFVARPDAHQVVALDLKTGAVRWAFTANGRVDTAPTIHKGVCLFGSKSGYVYALRADNGQLLWRLRAAPVDERMVAYGQLESPWPVPGSVLVADDVAYFAAGRQALADGGILVFAVNYATGVPRWVQRLHRVPQTNFYDSSALEFDNFDLLCLEDNKVAMSRWRFDRSGGAMSCDAKSGFAQMTARDGGVWFPRGVWSYAPRNETEQWKERPYLRPLAVFRGNDLFSCSQDRQTVFCRKFTPGNDEKFDTDWFKGWETYARGRKGGELWRSDRLAKNARWSVMPFGSTAGEQPVAAMVLTRNVLFAAGAQGRLVAIDPVDGRTLTEMDVPPMAWDAMAAVDGRLLLSTQDGQVVCLGAK
ncbi:MAG: PQQ-binding-like beta-propeller repeat protein [Verrucomicrobia bacterium]|nr:PQQ-binding-like beta-propeller repeat protein [Verrucomicrobiota bacterium]